MKRERERKEKLQHIHIISEIQPFYHIIKTMYTCTLTCQHTHSTRKTKAFYCVYKCYVTILFVNDMLQMIQNPNKYYANSHKIVNCLLDLSQHTSAPSGIYHAIHSYIYTAHKHLIYSHCG